MFQPRVIPVLLLRKECLVKSKRFKDYKYLGDAVNTVKIFDQLQADELILLDIEASVQKRLVSIELLQEIGEESNMPISAGGGIRIIKRY